VSIQWIATSHLETAQEYQVDHQGDERLGEYHKEAEAYAYEAAENGRAKLRTAELRAQHERIPAKFQPTYARMFLYACICINI
jgi:hypothetical protein